VEVYAATGLDNKYAITNIDFVRYMLDLKPDQYSAIEISIKKGASVQDIQDDLKKYWVRLQG
jgi:lipoprotein-releasing system permease protein